MAKREERYGNCLFSEWCSHSADAGMWLDYDAEVDVLYIHFEDKLTTTHSEVLDNGIIVDYRDDLLVGLTVLEASQR